MRIYIFKSETNGELRAFAGDLTGLNSHRTTVPGQLQA